MKACCPECPHEVSCEDLNEAAFATYEDIMDNVRALECEHFKSPCHPERCSHKPVSDLELPGQWTWSDLGGGESDGHHQ